MKELTVTTVFVELLLGGLLVCSWVALAAMLLFGPQPVYAVIQDPKPVPSFILAVFAYALGVIFDRFWDVILQPLDRKISSKFFPGGDDKRYEALKRHVRESSPAQLAFMDYIRSRMRIARATFCNMVFISLLGGAVLWNHYPDLFWQVSALALSVTLIAGIAFRKLSHTYHGWMKHFHEWKTAPNVAQT